MTSNPEIIEEFYGVYLLYCENPKYLGRTYVGFTVDPNRRIKQHNKGKKSGGARRTSKRGPWTMVMIIHGFPNDLSALRFEWAWQHPHASRRLHHVSKKQPRENIYDFHLRVLSEMLLVGPWNRLPLTIRWLNRKYSKELLVNMKSPPVHMPICYGPVISKKVAKNVDNNAKCSNSTEDKDNVCYICEENISGRAMSCITNSCSLIVHIVCLSRVFLKNNPGDYLPVKGECPVCGESILWGELVRKYKGCNSDYVDLVVNTEDANDFYSSDSDAN